MVLFWQSAAWGCAMVLSALFYLWHKIRFETDHLASILALTFICGLIAFALTKFALKVLVRRRRFETRLAASFLFLSVFTIGTTSFVYAIEYWSFFTRWHGEVFSALWFIQLFFTILGGFYQFAVIGLKFYLPVGLFFLVPVSYFLAKNP